MKIPRPAEKPTEIMLVEVESLLGGSGGGDGGMVVSHAGESSDERAEAAAEGLPLAGLGWNRCDIATNRRESIHPLVDVIGKHHCACGVRPVMDVVGQWW